MIDNLDKLDKKIIYEIDLNPRISLNILAKKLRINRNTLEYRLDNLIKKGIIKNFFAIVNGFNLGFNYYKYLVKVNKVSEDFSLEKLFQEENIVWIGETDGYWDFAFTLRAKNQDDLNNALNLINSLINVREKSLEIINIASVFNERWLIDSKEIKEIPNKFYNITKIDKVDKEILTILSNNAREKLVNISNRIKLTPEAVAKRLKNLEKSKIIMGYKARINYSLLGYDYYHLLLTVSSIEIKKNFLAFLKSFNNCITVIELLGKYDIQAEFIAKSHAEIRQIIDELKKNFPDQIQEIERLVIVKETKIKTFKVPRSNLHNRP